VICEAMLSIGVSLTLLDRAKTHWFVKRGKRRDDYRAEEIYMNSRIYLLGARESV